MSRMWDEKVPMGTSLPEPMAGYWRDLARAAIAALDKARSAAR